MFGREGRGVQERSSGEGGGGKTLSPTSVAWPGVFLIIADVGSAR